MGLPTSEIYDVGGGWNLTARPMPEKTVFEDKFENYITCYLAK